MPYIKQELRPDLNKLVNELADIHEVRGGPIPEGELNYLISKLVHMWINHKGLGYATLNSAIGVLECCKMELNRQVTAKYEDQKKLENGPVSNLDEVNINDVG